MYYNLKCILLKFIFVTVMNVLEKNFFGRSEREKINKIHSHKPIKTKQLENGDEYK